MTAVFPHVMITVCGTTKKKGELWVKALIHSFADKDTRAVFEGEASKKVPKEVQRRAQRKLTMIYHAADILDLKTPPGNKLEKLSGDRQGQHSIRVNERWRICFTWNRGAYDVEIVDYH